MFLFKKRIDAEVDEFLESKRKEDSDDGKVVTSKGDLLSKIPDNLYKTVEQRRRRLQLIGIIVAIAFAYLALAPYLGLTMEDSSFFIFLMSFAFVPSILIVGLIWIITSINQAVGIYENGIEVEDLNGDTHFYGWGLFKISQKGETKSKDFLFIRSIS